MKRTLSMLLAAVVATAGSLWLTGPADAHHAEAPFYHMDKTIQVKGVVTKWQFRNPHPFLYVEVTDEKGAKVEHVVEFVGAVRLAKLGWTAKTFIPGETVTVNGHPSREPGTYGISSGTVARADGKVVPGSGRGGNAPEAFRGVTPPEGFRPQ